MQPQLTGIKPLSDKWERLQVLERIANGGLLERLAQLGWVAPPLGLETSLQAGLSRDIHLEMNVSLPDWVINVSRRA